MKAHRWVVKKYDLTCLHSGHYGDPPRWSWWFVQMCLWCVVCCAEKFITAAFVIVPVHDLLDVFIARLEVPMEKYPKFELVLMMVIIPPLLNSVFAWIVDNLIKDPD